MTWSKTPALHARVACSCLSSLLLLSASLLTQPAHAQVGKEQARSGAKALVGLALLSSETVLTVEALVGVKPAWAYAVGGGLGAIAGGVGGYYIDRQNQPALSMSLLVGGLVFAIPTAILVFHSTAYRPAENPQIVTDDTANNALPLAQSIEARHALAHQVLPPSFFALSAQGQAQFSVPALSIRSVYSPDDEQIFALPQRASFRAPLFSLSFL